MGALTAGYFLGSVSLSGAFAQTTAPSPAPAAQSQTAPAAKEPRRTNPDTDEFRPQGVICFAIRMGVVIPNHSSLVVTTVYLQRLPGAHTRTGPIGRLHRCLRRA